MVQKRRSGKSPARGHRWAGLCLLALGVFFLAALLTYQPDAYVRAWERNEAHFPLAGQLVDFLQNAPAVHAGPASRLYHNAGGGLGLLLASLTVVFFGWIGVWIVPAVLLGWGWNRLLLKPVRLAWWRTLAGFPLVVSLAAIAAARGPNPSWSGTLGAGVWGAVFAGVGPVGGILVLTVAVLGFFFLEAEAWDGRWGTFTKASGRALATIVGKVARWAALAARFGVIWLGRGMRKAGLLGWAAITGGLSWLRRRPWESGAEVDPFGSMSAERFSDRQKDPAVEWPPRIVDGEPEPDPDPKPMPPVPPWKPSPARAESPARPQAIPSAASSTAPAAGTSRPGTQEPVVRRVSEGLSGAQDVEAAVMEARRQAKTGKKRSPSFLAAMQGKMVIPSLDILDDVPEIGPPVAESELLENSRILTDTLSDFGVTGRVGEVHPGPVITRYEYIPGPGVRVVQILNRQDDLALKLRASRIRILAPIPGKAAVGIEVPNRNPSPIFLKRLLETKAFHSAGGPLPLALGKDIGGAPITTELSKMPHLLIAGTTGSGKSVCMNALITSLLMKRTPAELRMLMIDPKMLELPMYNGIPHLLMDVVTDPKLAARSLKWALVEMERRYKILAARGCRNLQSYNKKMDEEGAVHDGEEKLPYVVVLIDELADLMITSGKEVEEPIGRLAQTARAVGIHLIVATQRPSVDVITGVLKANFPSRIAFQVASRTDSRTILDQNGAESLLGKGDMLFLPPGQAVPLRVHGAFVSEEETQRLAEAWRSQGEPTSYSGLEEALAEPETGVGALGEDPLFEDAARLVVAAGQASASLLQRRLKVGYARAARLVDMLEMAGVVTSQDGSKAREILVDDVRLESVLAGMDE